MEPTEAKEHLINCIKDSKDIAKLKFEEGDVAGLCGEQVDAIVDSYYYSLNAAAKCGMNASSVFNLVHGANMAKRDPESGKFLKRADGKIIKPKGWTAPDVRKELQRQIDNGAWESNENKPEN